MKDKTIKRNTTNVLCGLLAATVIGLAVAVAADQPAASSLPTPGKPDGKEANMSKPVQVYILMGQSNMLGMGKITGGEGSLETAVKNKK
jgi:hypothetical protein